MNTYIYIFVRKDISPAQVAVQSSHAAIEMCKLRKVKGIPSIVLLGIHNEEELLYVKGYLEDNNVDYAHFIEPDMGNNMAAIATVPVKQAQRAMFRKFKLYGRN